MEWDSNPRLRRDQCLKLAPWTARPSNHDPLAAGFQSPYRSSRNCHPYRSPPPNPHRSPGDISGGSFQRLKKKFPEALKNFFQCSRQNAPLGVIGFFLNFSPVFKKTPQNPKFLKKAKNTPSPLAEVQIIRPSMITSIQCRRNVGRVSFLKAVSE